MTRATPKYVLLTALLVLAGGCSTSGVSAFHGVGAAPKRQANAPVQVARDVAPESPAALGRTQKVASDAGLSLNVAGAAQPQTLAATNVPPQPEMGTNRAEAVSGIRAKAENSPDTPPNVFDVKRPPVNQMTAAEQAQFKAEMEAAGAANGTVPENANGETDPVNWLRKKK